MPLVSPKWSVCSKQLATPASQNWHPCLQTGGNKVSAFIDLAKDMLQHILWQSCLQAEGKELESCLQDETISNLIFWEQFLLQTLNNQPECELGGWEKNPVEAGRLHLQGDWHSRIWRAWRSHLRTTKKSTEVFDYDTNWQQEGLKNNWQQRDV